MTGIKITLYVLLAIVILYLAFFVYVLHCVLSFRSKMDKRLSALSILYSEKRDVLLSLDSLLSDKLKEASQDPASERLAVDALKLDKFSGEVEAQNAANVISAFQKRLTMFASSEGLQGIDAKELDRHLSALHDLDTNARRLIAIYNSEVIAYEYWRKIWAYRWLLFIFGFKKRVRLV